LKALTEARELPKSIREELEYFFVTVAAFTGKKITIRGWASRREAQHFVKSCQMQP
jgi:inorganic pyrophosphatase